MGTVALLTAVTIHSVSYATNPSYRSRYNSIGSSTAHLISNSAKEIGNFVGNLFSSDESETSGSNENNPRFVVEPDGTAVDTDKTPAGTYVQPNGNETDVLQKKEHYDKPTKKM